VISDEKARCEIAKNTTAEDYISHSFFLQKNAVRPRAGLWRLFNLPLRAANNEQPACIGQAGKREMKMKKKVVLALLLLAVAAVGSVFAQSGRDIPYELKVATTSNGTPSGVSIVECKQSLTGVNISYSSPQQRYILVFNFLAYYEDGSYKMWSNEETLITARNKSTWRFTVLNPSKIKRMVITYENKSLR
jgi:hypothetical protein